MKRALLIGLLTGLAAAAQAQQTLTIHDAVRTALEQNTTLAGARQGVEAARWGQLNALTSMMPKVEVAAGVTRIDVESERRANQALEFIKELGPALGFPPSMMSDVKPFAYRDTYTAGLTVVQPIYNGGAEFLGVRFADAESDRSIFSLRDAEQEVTARTKVAFYNVVKAEKLVELAREVVERTSRHLDLTRRRADLGQRTRTDVLRWEVELASAEGSLVEATNGLSAARIQLNEVMGVDLASDYRYQLDLNIDSVLHSDSAPVAWNTHASLENVSTLQLVDASFLEGHPSMRIMNTNLRLAELQIDQSWVNFKPRVNLAFQYGWEQNNTVALDGIRPWALALRFSWPIFNGFGDYTSLQRANAEYKRTEAQVDAYRRGLVMQASVAQFGLRSAKKRIEIARKAQDEAKDVLNSITRRYETGGASNVDLIDGQTAYTSARANFIAAAYDYLIAEITYERATGTIAGPVQVP
jgi:outer membrane protein TolC